MIKRFILMGFIGSAFSASAADLSAPYPTNCRAEDFHGKFIVDSLERCDHPDWDEGALLEVNGKPDTVWEGAHTEPGIQIVFTIKNASGQLQSQSFLSSLHDSTDPASCHQDPFSGGCSMIIARLPGGIGYNPAYAIYDCNGEYTAATPSCYYKLRKQYYIVPHYRSDHPESAMMENVVSYYEEKKLPFYALKDGEALVVNGTKIEKVE